MRYGGDWRRWIVGDWHSHVGRSAEPSEPDLKGFVAGLRRVEAAGGTRYVGVIVVRRDGELQLVGYLHWRNAAGAIDVDVVRVTPALKRRA